MPLALPFFSLPCLSIPATDVPQALAAARIMAQLSSPLQVSAWWSTQSVLVLEAEHSLFSIEYVRDDFTGSQKQRFYLLVSPPYPEQPQQHHTHAHCNLHAY